MKYLSVLIALMAARGLMAQSALHWPITDVTTPDSCTVNAHSPLIIMPAQDTVNVCPDPSWTSIPGMSSLSPLAFHPATFHYGTTANGASYMNLGHSSWFTVGAVFQISGTGTFTVDSVQIKHYGINNPAISSYRVDLADSQWVWDIVDGIPPTDDVHDLTSAGLYVNGDFSFRIWAIMPTGTWASADTALAQPFQGDYWSIDEVNICITPTSEKHLGIKAILEGSVMIANTLMRDDLRTSGLIPLNEPYTQLGYSFAGGGGESIASSVLNVSGPDAIVDWVVVELRDTSNFSLIYSRSALIQRDGDVVDLDGVSLVGVAIPQGAFQVVLRHRNHLPIRTVCPVALTDTAYIDWTDPATETCQPDALKNISGVPLLWAGNVLMDDEVKYIGSANDRDPILIRIGGSVPTNTVQGYFEEDVNMDGTVKYIGASNDRDPILLNIGGSVPTNVLGGPLDAGCGACTTYSCADGFQNGQETGVDCGGPDCVDCNTLCSDGIMNGDETGIDCGGSSCGPCSSLCGDGLLNGNELGVDCGGPDCVDCATLCSDGIQNGDETGVDCGGTSCGACLNVQQRLDTGETPKQIYDSGAPLDSLYGKTYEEGILFYLNTLTGTGLIAAPFDQDYLADFTREWGCYGAGNTTIPGADGTSIGTGEQNTIDIEAGCTTAGTAADICANLTIGIYSDWFLPSKEELNQMFLALAPIGFGGSAGNDYWSSSEVSPLSQSSAWKQNLATGAQHTSVTSNAFYVRAVRSF